jgi:hypothetical protein
LGNQGAVRIGDGFIHSSQTATAWALSIANWSGEMPTEHSHEAACLITYVLEEVTWRRDCKWYAED